MEPPPQLSLSGQMPLFETPSLPGESFTTFGSAGNIPYAWSISPISPESLEEYFKILGKDEKGGLCTYFPKRKSLKRRIFGFLDHLNVPAPVSFWGSIDSFLHFCDIDRRDCVNSLPIM